MNKTVKTIMTLMFVSYSICLLVFNMIFAFARISTTGQPCWMDIFNVAIAVWLIKMWTGDIKIAFHIMAAGLVGWGIYSILF